MMEQACIAGAFLKGVETLLNFFVRVDTTLFIPVYTMFFSVLIFKIIRLMILKAYTIK